MGCIGKQGFTSLGGPGAPGIVPATKRWDESALKLGRRIRAIILTRNDQTIKPKATRSSP